VLYCDDEDYKVALSKIQDTLVELHIWCDKLGLTINYEKTKLMIFHKSGDNKNKMPTDIHLTVNNNIIERVFEFKYIGVILDPSLSFINHANKVKKTVATHIGALRRVFKFLPFNVFCIVTNAFVFSHIDYCLPIWGCRPILEMDSIQYVISKFIMSYFYSTKVLSKFLTFKKNTKSKPIIKTYLNSATEFNILEKCNFLTVTERLNYYCFTQMFQFLRFNLNGEKFNQIFDFNIKETRTRSENTVDIPRILSESYRRSMKYRLSKLWNDLPNELRDLKLSVNKFKEAISKHIIMKRKNKFCYE